MTGRSVTPKDLAYPVLALSRDSSICVYLNAEQLCCCNALAYWKNSYYQDLLVFDSNASEFRVVSSEPAQPLSGLRRALLRLINGQLRVDLGLRREGSATLETVKHQVGVWMHRAPDFWEAADDLSIWEERVASCTNMEQLIDIFD